MQHQYARRIRERVKTQNSTLALYADLAEADYTRLGRLLRGDIIMRLEDIANADRTMSLLPERLRGDDNHERTTD
jgi:hypothetical protein